HTAAREMRNRAASSAPDTGTCAESKPSKGGGSLLAGDDVIAASWQPFPVSVKMERGGMPAAGLPHEIPCLPHDSADDGRSAVDRSRARLRPEPAFSCRRI